MIRKTWTVLSALTLSAAFVGCTGEEPATTPTPAPISPAPAMPGEGGMEGTAPAPAPVTDPAPVSAEPKSL